MRIYSMTATFGKLEHETLTLKPGLNRIEAPNEWGKSTWCAFLVAMLYGLDTRAKSTKQVLADKEHYAPWSGSPMAGRMDIQWKGRNITIERTTKGRIPMGEFRAYETQTGLDVPELDAANCGQMLLGVERSVFLRSGFIRFSDLPVSDDEALRRRLNNLVTTGDESGGADRLAAGVRELKNRIRYNRTGLLPQAEAQRDSLEEILRELGQLCEQAEQNRERLDRTEDWRILLENHRRAIAYAAAQEDARLVARALDARNDAQKRLKTAEELCDGCPDRETACRALEEIECLHQEQEALRTEAGMILEPEEPDTGRSVFAGLPGRDAVQTAKADREKYRSLSEKRYALPVLGILLLILAAVLLVWYPLPGYCCAGSGIAVLTLALALSRRRRKQARLLADRYGTSDPNRWVQEARAYADRLETYHRAQERTAQAREQLRQDMIRLQSHIQEATEGRGLEECRENWTEVISAWDALEAARKEWQQAEQHYQAIRAMARTSPAPEFPDRMEHTEAETAHLLAECLAERQRLENRMGQFQGRIEAIGDPQVLEQKLAAANSRIRQLEKTYTALTIAQETLAEAAAELQRRFAPRISRRTRELMARLTGGRYERLRLGDDLGIQAGSSQEDTLREILWRSDGTVDQLYLSLRLAVSEELTPEAPLILDDALVRFDDTRLKAALDILKEEAKQKQVILFTCQSREKNME